MLKSKAKSRLYVDKAFSKIYTGTYMDSFDIYLVSVMSSSGELIDLTISCECFFGNFSLIQFMHYQYVYNQNYSLVTKETKRRFDETHCSFSLVSTLS